VAGLQLAGVIDELYFYDGPLGARVSDDGTSIAVWAPTAQQVIRTSLAAELFCASAAPGLGRSAQAML